MWGGVRSLAGLRSEVGMGQAVSCTIHPHQASPQHPHTWAELPKTLLDHPSVDLQGRAGGTSA